MFRSDAEDMMIAADTYDDTRETEGEAMFDDTGHAAFYDAVAFLNDDAFVRKMDDVNDVADILERYGSIPVNCNVNIDESDDDGFEAEYDAMMADQYADCGWFDADDNEHDDFDSEFWNNWSDLECDMDGWIDGMDE